MIAHPETAATLEQDFAKPEWTTPTLTVVSVEQTLNSGTTSTDQSTLLQDS